MVEHNLKRILLLDLDKPKKNKYQFYLDWFKKAWIDAEGEIKPKIDFPFQLKMALAKSGVARRIKFSKKDTALLVTGGAYIDFTAFPYNYFYEVVPVFWDTWKKYHPLMISSLKRNKVKLAFFTQKEVAALVEREIPGIKTYWLPEGIESTHYIKGSNLIDRKIQILQFGRKFENYHEVILKAISANHTYLFSRDDQKIFKDFKELTEGISNSAITICFPRSMTHPEITGGIETLTQRYWECMLSKSLIVGKAPKELIEIMGYNPVIEVDWRNPDEQLKELLNSIGEYQPFVNENYLRALEICSWDNRINTLQMILKNHNYEVTFN